MSSSAYREEVARLQREIQSERAAREEAETEVKKWRDRTIRTKIDSIHSRRSASVTYDDISEESRTSREGSALGESAVSDRIKKELEGVREQRELLLKTIEDAQGPVEETEEDKSLPLEERVELERERRRVSQGLAKALRAMFDDSEKQRAALQGDRDMLRAEYERTRTLLTMAEQVLAEKCGSLACNAGSSRAVCRIGSGTSPAENKKSLISAGTIVAAAALALTAAVVIRKNKR